MRFVLAVLAFLTAAVNGEEKRVVGAMYKDPNELPEPCPSQYGMLLKTYIPGTKQASLTVPCELTDKECLNQWPGV